MNKFHFDIITLSHQLSREGFEELTIDQALNEEEIIEYFRECI